MKPKTWILAATLTLILLSGVSVSAQQDEIELTRTLIQTERQAILAQAMSLTEDESKRFWPMYRDYLVAVNKLVDRHIALITTYADNYQDLSDENAAWILDEFIALEKAEAELKAQWVPRFREILPAKKVARFFQLENKMDAVIEYDLATSIPLVE